MAKDQQPFEALSETAEKALENARRRAHGAMDNYFATKPLRISI
jgi:hypothetical protein